MEQAHSLKPVSDAYERELRQRGYTSDPAQLLAVAALERCALAWIEYKEKRSNALKNCSVDRKYRVASTCLVALAGAKVF